MNRESRYHTSPLSGPDQARRSQELVTFLRLAISAAQDAGDVITGEQLLPLILPAKRRAEALESEIGRPASIGVQ